MSVPIIHYTQYTEYRVQNTPHIDFYFMDITVTTLLNGSVSQISPSLLLSSSLWLYCMRIYALLTGTTLTQLLFLFFIPSHSLKHSFFFFAPCILYLTCVPYYFSIINFMFRSIFAR